MLSIILALALIVVALAAIALTRRDNSPRWLILYMVFAALALAAYWLAGLAGLH